MSKGADFEGWYAEKSRVIAKARERESALQEAKEAERDAALAKGAVAFKGWVLESSVHDRALEILPDLSSGRFSDDDSWRQTAVCLSFVDACILEGHRARGSDPHVNPKRSMEHMFCVYSRKNHSFDNVTISAKLAGRFSRGARAMFEAADDNFVMSGLSYVIIQRVGELNMAKPLTPDDKLRNAIFNSMVKKTWVKAQEEAHSALDSEAGGPFGASPEVNAKRGRISHAKGLLTLSAWAHEDVESAKKKEIADHEARREAGRGGHARWLELKDRSRVKLPPQAEDDFQDPILSKLDCMAPKGVAFRRAKAVKPVLDTSADMARRMGIALKTGYAHALSGNAADLEKSRKKLLDEGWVFLENFADPETGEIGEEARAKYAEALAGVAAGRAKKAAERRATDASAFGAWVETKEGSELAREVMSIMPVVLTFDDPSQLSAADEAKGGAAGTGIDARSVTSGAGAAKEGVDKPLLGRAPTEDEHELWRAVGYACKAVSRSLLPDWMRWSAPLFSKSDCLKNWETFRPKNHEADMAVHRAKVADEERKKREAREKEDRDLGIEPRAEAPPTPSRGGKAGGGGGGGGSQHGGDASLSMLYKMPKPHEPEMWLADDRARALKLLHLLSIEHRKLAKFKLMARTERAPVLPVLRRQPSAETLPAFLHGHEGSIKRLQTDLAIPEGKGLSMLGATGVGAELVLQWFVGEDDINVDPKLGLAALQESAARGASASASAVGDDDQDEFDAEEGEEGGEGHHAGSYDGGAAGEGKDGETGGVGVEGPRKLVSRMRASAADAKAKRAATAAAAAGGPGSVVDPSYSGPYQPPYVMIVETCGVAGGKRQLDGDWVRVMVDPPEAMPILTSIPGSSYVPLSAKYQGVGKVPPAPGAKDKEWEADPLRLRGGIRIVGLLPNTSYCYRVRAYSRIGASNYAFGVFTTAAAPPPAPIIALPSLVPRHLLSVSAAGSSADPASPPPPPTELTVPPCDVDSVSIIWERRIDLRTGLLRLLRTFYYCVQQTAKAAQRQQQQQGRAGLAGGRSSAAGGGNGVGGTYSSASSRANSIGGGGAGLRDEYAEEMGPNNTGGGAQFEVDEEEEDGGDGGSRPAPPSRPMSAGIPSMGVGAASPSTLFTSARVQRAVFLRALQLEVGLRNWLASCVSVVEYWPPKEGATLEEFGGGAGGDGDASTFRRLPARFKVALNRPCSVLEALVLDSRPVLSWDDVTALFEADIEADDAFDLLLAGTSVGGALGLGDASGKGIPQAERAPRKTFSLSGGALSVLSVQRNTLRKTMTVSKGETANGSRPSSAGPSLGGGGTALVPRGLPPAGRPGSAAQGGRAAADLTAQLTFMRSKRRGSVSASVNSTSSSAAKNLAASLRLQNPSSDVTVKYSVLQCISDGSKGQEWLEVFVGIRSLRRLDKLLPGTSYCFKVQAINQDGQGSLFGPPAIITTALPAPTNVRVYGRVSSSACTITWDEVSSANALANQRAMSGGGGAGGDDEGADGGAGGGGAKKGAKGADIDAVLAALLQKTRSGAKDLAKEAAAAREGGAPYEGADDKDIFASVAGALAIREGDGGVGVDLSRTWSRYDTERTGFIAAAQLRGLLADLGTYSETAALVNAAMDAAHSLGVASGEGAASAGPGEWRLQAALATLDPKGTGSILYSEFVDWWNAVDAALAKARGVSLADQLEAKALESGAAGRGGGDRDGGGRPGSASSFHTGTTGVGAAALNSAAAQNLHAVLGEGVVVEDLSFAIAYVLEVRRLLTKTEAAAVASGGPLPGALRPSGGASAAAHVGGGGADNDDDNLAPPPPEEEEEEVMGATVRSSSGGAGRAGGVGAGAGGAAGRPGSSAGAAAAGAPALSSPSPASIAAAPLYTLWSAVYVGPDISFRLTDLLPNGEYQMRVSALGRHAYSSPSKLATINIPPLSPFAPVLVKTDPRAVYVRWYPGELGADKFEVQVKMIDALKRETSTSFPGSSAAAPSDDTARLRTTQGLGLVALDGTGRLYHGRNVSETVARRLATSRNFTQGVASGAYGGHAPPNDAGESEMWAEHPEEAWATLYTGTGTFAALTGLYANAVYHMRVVAYNAAGVPSRPSPETQVVTAGNAALEPVSVATAPRLFVVECVPSAVSDPSARHLRGRQPVALQDVVVGDTILFTEDVFINSGPEHDPYHPRGPLEVHSSHPKAAFFCSRTVAARVIADSASLVTAGHGHSANIANPGGPVPVGATATAFSLSGYLGGLSTSKLKTATGREVVSVRPASASARRKADAGAATDSGTKHLGPATTMEDALRARSMSLQVEFSTVSKTRATGFAYTHGAIIRRTGRDLMGLDMFRTLWEDEAGRWTLAEEMRASYDV